MLELNRPVVCLLETLQWQGGVALDTHHHACPDNLQAALATCHILPFHREPGFKEASIRLVLEALLPCVASSVNGLLRRSPHLVYLPNENTNKPLVLPAPAREFHLYISKSNVGAEELVRLLEAEQNGWNEGKLLVTTSSPMAADVWLLYLSRCVHDSQKQALKLSYR